MALIIRQARADEYEAVAGLTVKAYRTIDPELGPYEQRIRDVAGRAAVATVLVAVDDSALVGTATYVPGPRSPLAESDDPGDAGMRMLAVAPAVERRGIGTALVRRCLELARDDGFRRLVLLTRPTMRAAHAVYRRLRFERAPELDETGPEVVLWAFVRDLRHS